MFNFFRKKPIATADPFRRKLPEDGRSFAEFAENEVAIKIWLPEPVDKRLHDFCDYFCESRAKLLRSIYFVYLYGRYDFERMRQESLGLFARSEEARFCKKFGESVTHRSGAATTPELGKNNVDVKLWMPTKMNADLQRIADNAQIPLSQVLREVLISALFGHSYLADRAQWDFVATSLNEQSGLQIDPTIYVRGAFLTLFISIYVVYSTLRGTST